MEARLNTPVMDQPALPTPGRAVHYSVPLALALTLAAALALHSPRLFAPAMFTDDFIYVVEAWTWRTTLDNLWKPFNEHCMPLGRLSNWALVRLTGRPTMLPLAMGVQNLLALLAVTGLLYLFVRRELGHPFYGLVAMMSFGLSSVYAEAVSWFSCSFGVLAVATLLLALLAAQRWQQTGGGSALALSALCSALAPAWSAGGILAGPCCCLYLLASRKGPDDEAGREEQRPSVGALLRQLATAAVPVWGSVVFLAVSLPRTANYILHLNHYDGQTAIEAFRPLIGLEYTCRSLVDNLVLGVAGLWGVVLPFGMVAAGLVVIAVMAGWWWRLAPQRRLLVLGLSLILVSYWLTYSARSLWSYQGQAHAWTRYHVMPQLGLVLFLCGGLPRWQHRWKLELSGTLSRRPVLILAGLLAVLFAMNLPRSVALTPCVEPGQAEMLQRVAAVDARCRQYHIDADTARRALDRLPVPGWEEIDQEANGWVFLRGSDSPRPVSVAEARRLLNP